MRLILCDRCGKKTEPDEVRKTMTISSIKDDGSMKMIHCDRLLLLGRGEIKVEHEIDLCDTCKESFVNWFGKIGIYER